jgi:hypothetical protein
MADLSITASSVTPGVGCVIETFTAAAAITAGQVVYFDGATARVGLADADASASTQAAIGVALNSALAAGAPVSVVRSGPITLNAVAAKGTAYYVSKTAGGIAPAADITGAGTYWTLLGIGLSTTSILINPIVTGVQV